MALVGRSGVLASAGSMIDEPAALRVAERAIDGGSELSTSIDEHFLVASPVLANDGVPVMALVLSLPRSQIDATREDPFRVLFLVAMGAAAIALRSAEHTSERQSLMRTSYA